jgi:hypothetical protein
MQHVTPAPPHHFSNSPQLLLSAKLLSNPSKSPAIIGPEHKASNKSGILSMTQERFEWLEIPEEPSTKRKKKSGEPNAVMGKRCPQCNWLDEETDRKNSIDKSVRKENKRRNIQLDGDIYKDQLYNFTPNLSFQHILEIYGIEGNEITLTSNNLNLNSKSNFEIQMNDNSKSFNNEPSTIANTMDIDDEYCRMNIDADFSLDLRRK